jgi:hypothetical protein
VREARLSHPASQCALAPARCNYFRYSTVSSSVRAVRVPRGKAALVRVGPEGEAPKDHGHGQDALSEARLEEIQEWVQVRAVFFFCVFGFSTV